MLLFQGWGALRDGAEPEKQGTFGSWDGCEAEKEASTPLPDGGGAKENGSEAFLGGRGG